METYSEAKYNSVERSYGLGGKWRPCRDRNAVLTYYGCDAREPNQQQSFYGGRRAFKSPTENRHDA